MQVRPDLARRLARQPGHDLELLARRGQDGLRRAEVRHQRALARRADPRQVVEDRRRHRAVAARAVMGDGEAVGLVAHALQQLQLGLVVRDPDRLAPAGYEHLLDALGQGDHGHPAPAEALERAQARRELPRAAVDDDQVGQRGERLVALGVVRAEVLLGLPLREPTAEDLLHGGEVVGHALLPAAHVEAPVVGLLRRAAFEDDHRRDLVGAHQVGDVEALDAQRQRVEPQGVLQPVERLDALLAAALGLQALLVERQQRVALGQLEDPPLVAALGGPDLDLGPAALTERFGQRIALLDVLLDDDLRWDRHLVAVVLQQELLGHLPYLALDGVLEVEGLAVGEHAVADLEDLRVGVGPVDRDGHDVDRPDRLVGHALALEEGAHGAQAVALERRLLVVARDRGRLHLVLEVALDLAVAPGEEGHDAVDRLVVLLGRHVADAGRPAALDVVVQARGARAPPRLDALAGAEEEDLAQKVQRAAYALGVRVGAEVDAVAAVALAREVNPRELLVHRDGDERIGLVVAQADVEARAVLLDEVLLGQQRLGLGGDEDELDRVDRVDHLVGAARDRIGEVAGDAFAQRLGLADVDDLALGVAEQVDARPVRQRLALLGEAGPATL